MPKELGDVVTGQQITTIFFFNFILFLKKG
jgi:hypothetical protein